jgi:hypothetical protein
VEIINSLLWVLNTNVCGERQTNKRLRCNVQVLTAVLIVLVRFITTPTRHPFTTKRRSPFTKRPDFLNQIAGWFLNPIISKHNANSELLGFWPLSIVWSYKTYRAQRFGNWICFRPQVENGSSFRNVVFYSF